MKQIKFSAALLSIFLSVILATSSASSQTSDASTSSTGADRARKYDEILNQGLEQSKKQALILRAAEEQNQRFSNYVKNSEALLAKQDRLFSRYDRILDTWEKQQKQYQVYLDRLTKTNSRMR